MFQFGSSCSLSYQSLSIKYYPDSGIVCLTDLWRAQCSPASQRPLAWVRLLATQKLLKRLAWTTSVDPLWSERQQPGQKSEHLIIGIPGILETFKDERDLHTYTTTNLAIVYAHYLAPECYEWARSNLAKETALVEQWSAYQSQVESQKQHKTFTRRAVVAAGWSIPIVSALALNQRAAAQVSAGRSSSGTTSTSTTKTVTTTTTGTTTGLKTTTTGTTTGLGTTTTGLGTTTTGLGTTTTGLGTTTTGLGTTTTGLGTTTTGLGTTTTGLGTTTTGLGTTTTGLGTTTTGLGTTTTGTTTGLGTTGLGTTTTGTTTGLGTTTTGTTTGLGTTTTGTTGTGTGL